MSAYMNALRYEIDQQALVDEIRSAVEYAEEKLNKTRQIIERRKEYFERECREDPARASEYDMMCALEVVRPKLQEEEEKLAKRKEMTKKFLAEERGNF